MIVSVEKTFEAWKVKPISVNKWADLYNDTCIRLRREKIDTKEISSTELCWLAYARYLDTYIAPDDVVFDAGTNQHLADIANRWFGDDSIILNGKVLNPI